jgi:hypothetical protein
VNLRAGEALEDANQLALGNAAESVFVHVDDDGNDGGDNNENENGEKNKHGRTFREMEG